MGGIHRKGQTLWLALALSMLVNPNYSSSLRNEGYIYNKISDKVIEAYPLIW